MRKCWYPALFSFFMMFQIYQREIAPDEPQWIFINKIISATQSRFLTTLNERPFENIEGKGENACYKRFPLFPQSFLTFLT